MPHDTGRSGNRNISDRKAPRAVSNEHPWPLDRKPASLRGLKIRDEHRLISVRHIDHAHPTQSIGNEQEIARKRRIPRISRRDKSPNTGKGRVSDVNNRHTRSRNGDKCRRSMSGHDITVDDDLLRSPQGETGNKIALDGIFPV